MEKILMPSGEWDEFKTRCLDPHHLNHNDVARYRVVFLGALAAATDFFSNLYFGDLSDTAAREYYDQWLVNLQSEMGKFEAEAIQFFGGVDGRVN